MSARIEASCRPQFEILTKIEFGPQAARAVVKRFQLLADIVELAAPDVGAQASRQERQVVQRDRDRDAIRRGGHANFIVGRRDLDRQADDLPRRQQPLHDQRQRERQQLRRLQRRYVERGSHRRNLGIAEGTQLARQPAAQRVERFPGPQHSPDRQQILDDIGRADARQHALGILARHRRRDLRDRLACGRLEFAGRGFETGIRTALPGIENRGFECACGVSRAVAAEPLPDRLQRGATDLAGPDRKIALDKERLERLKQQPRRIVGTRAGFVVFLDAAHDLAQLLQHEVGDGCVLSPLDGALELPHQQRLRLWRELGEIVPQPLGRCLAHAPGVYVRVSSRTAEGVRSQF